MKTQNPKRETDNLVAWLNSPAADAYFGHAFVLKFAALAATAQGRNLAEIARQHGVSRQRTHALAKQARELFGISR